MTITNTPTDNGVNVEALFGAREAMTGTPAAATSTWPGSLTAGVAAVKAPVGSRHPKVRL
jgi:hypothetical protein